MPILTITLDHLNAANLVPWSTTTCVIAQAFKAVMPDLTGCSYSGVFNNGRKFEVKSREDHHKLLKIQNAFDAAHGGNRTRDYDRVAKMLPVTIEYTEEKIF